MSPADAWLLAMMWNDDLEDGEADMVGNPFFWEWFDGHRDLGLGSA